MTEKSIQLPMPKDVDGILRHLRRMLTLERTIRIIIDEHGITLVRDVDEGMEVLPAEMAPKDFDVQLLFEKLEIIPYAFDPALSPMFSFAKATHALQRKEIVPIAIVVPSVDAFVAWVGLDMELRPGHYFMGLKLIEDTQGMLQDKALIIGAAHNSFLPEESTHGVVMDVLT